LASNTFAVNVHRVIGRTLQIHCGDRRDHLADHE
jgi:hypothetical protein